MESSEPEITYTYTDLSIWTLTWASMIVTEQKGKIKYSKTSQVCFNPLTPSVSYFTRTILVSFWGFFENPQWVGQWDTGLMFYQ